MHKDTLDQIGLRCQTDKASSGHNYLQFYEKFLEPYRHSKGVLLEVGVGGYHYPDRGGQSVRMWLEYFTKMQINCIDLFTKIPILYAPAKFFRGDQTDVQFLEKVITTIGTPDIIIDDASHINDKSIKTFDILFGLLKPGGIYIWEDVHTSLWVEDYAGNPAPMAPHTALHYLARLMYGLQVDTIREDYREKWDGHIEAMHFMRNTCVIIKRK